MGKTPTNECLGYDTKTSDGEIPILEHWEMWSTLSLSLLPGPLWPKVGVPDSVPPMSQIELIDYVTLCKQMPDVKLSC